MAEFEDYWHAASLRLFVLSPRSPKIKWRCRARQPYHTEEFWGLYGANWTVRDCAPALRAWEDEYNTVRPHQALGYLTPRQWLDEHAPAPVEQTA
jgi:hypothetical protein